MVGLGWGGQGAWEWRIEAFVKIQKKKNFWRGGGRVGRGEGASGSGVRVDVSGEVKFLCEFKKKKLRVGGVRVGWGGGGGLVELGGGGSGCMGTEN